MKTALDEIGASVEYAYHLRCFLVTGRFFLPFSFSFGMVLCVHLGLRNWA